MESKLQRRLDSEEDIVDLQLKQMLHRADGFDLNVLGGSSGTKDGYGGGYGAMGGMLGAVKLLPLVGHDVSFGLTRVQRLDTSELADDDPLKRYVELSKDVNEAKPTTDKEKLKQTLLAFHNFESFFKHLPRSENRLTAGAPPHSWRVAILPLLGRIDLYNEYRFDQPWNSEENLNLREPSRVLLAWRMDSCLDLSPTPSL